MSRAQEVVLALAILVVLAPVIAVIGALILIVDGRPIFFLSPRMRDPERRFMMIKFRTMRPGSDQGVTGGSKASRVTRLGKVLRRTRLDELPQILNILRGDMAFVGPRPPAPEYVRAEPELYARVLMQRPGVTGLATLVLHRREQALLAQASTARAVDLIYRRRCLPIKARIDLIYRRRCSPANDLWLMALTALRVVDAGGSCRLPRLRRRIHGARSGSQIMRIGWAGL